MYPETVYLIFIVKNNGCVQEFITGSKIGDGVQDPDLKLVPLQGQGLSLVGSHS